MFWQKCDSIYVLLIHCYARYARQLQPRSRFTGHRSILTRLRQSYDQRKSVVKIATYDRWPIITIHRLKPNRWSFDWRRRTLAVKRWVCLQMRTMWTTTVVAGTLLFALQFTKSAGTYEAGWQACQSRVKWIFNVNGADVLTGSSSLGSTGHRDII